MLECFSQIVRLRPGIIGYKVFFSLFCERRTHCKSALHQHALILKTKLSTKNPCMGRVKCWGALRFNAAFKIGIVSRASCCEVMH